MKFDKFKIMGIAAVALMAVSTMMSDKSKEEQQRSEIEKQVKKEFDRREKEKEES